MPPHEVDQSLRLLGHDHPDDLGPEIGRYQDGNGIRTPICWSPNRRPNLWSDLKPHQQLLL